VNLLFGGDDPNRERNLICPRERVHAGTLGCREYRKSPNGTAVGLLPTPTIDATGTMPELDHVSVHRS